MFAWQTARWDRSSRAVVAGNVVGCRQYHRCLDSSAGPHDCGAEPHAVRIRWGDDPCFWRDLLSAASRSDQQRLSMLQLTGKLRICSELAEIRD